MSAGRPLAIVALSPTGVLLATRLHQELPGSALHAPGPDEASAAALQGEPRLGTSDPPQAERPRARGSTAALLARLWPDHDLVLVMAVGAAVRLLAPLLVGKRVDPAVVVLDDQGRHAVSLLGGHRAGANRLAQRVAALIGADPVVSTASDLVGALAVDLLGEPFGWRLEQAPAAVALAAAEGAELGVYQDAGERDAWRVGASRLRDFPTLEALAASGLPGIAISERVLPGGLPTERWTIWRPRTLVVGVGCVRGATREEIEAVVAEALERGGLARASLAEVATLDLKQDELGLRAFADQEGLPLRAFDASTLDRIAVPSPSEEVRRHVGTAGVCEPAALLAAAADTLLVPKVKHARATAAIARRAASRPGRLSVIGLGPDGREHLTVRARQRLLEADVLVGYLPYVEQVRAWLPATPAEPSPIGQESARAARAVDLALAGRRVALVSSGDAGIYGMAGLVLEEMAARGLGDEQADLVEIVPGVTAASAAGAVLGAPLMADFAVLSLSDLQMPWPRIERRLLALAATDLTLALYNPSSGRRAHRFARARAILLEARPPDTPVALVRNALRPGQEVILTDLASLPEQRVDMWSLVLVAGAGVRRLGPWLVAGRGAD